MKKKRGRPAGSKNVSTIRKEANAKKKQRTLHDSFNQRAENLNQFIQEVKSSAQKRNLK